jgi:hypothetical protein
MKVKSVLTSVTVTKPRVWIGKSVYWIFTTVSTNNSSSFKITVVITHVRSSIHLSCKHFALVLLPWTLQDYPHWLNQSLSQSRIQNYTATYGQSVSKFWRHLLLFECHGLVSWGALSDERTGLSSVYAAGPCQRSLSRARLPWDSRPYFIVSDLRLPFPSPPTTRTVTVEVFDPASTRVTDLTKSQNQNQSHIATDGQSVRLCVEPNLRLMTRYLLLFDSHGLVFVGRPLWREDGSAFSDSHCLQ